MTLLQITCFVICFGDSAGQTPPIETFCTNYNRVVISREDRNSISGLSKEVRRRLQANEIDYRCRCQGWKNPVCKGRN